MGERSLYSYASTPVTVRGATHPCFGLVAKTLAGAICARLLVSELTDSLRLIFTLRERNATRTMVAEHNPDYGRPSGLLLFFSLPCAMK